MKANTKPIKLVLMIANRRDGKKLWHTLVENGYNFHDAFLGRGTAPDEISSVLGLGEPEKVIFCCLLDIDRAKALLEFLNKDFFGERNGLAFMLPINSASNLEVVNLILNNN